MSMIKGKNTKPEIALRRILFAYGLRGYRLHYALPGKPDITFPKRKIAIFIDGCFWHKCPKCFVEPVANKIFWMKKIKSNVMRDELVSKTLKGIGWKVIRILEHELKNDKIIKKKVIDKLMHGE